MGIPDAAGSSSDLLIEPLIHARFITQQSAQSQNGTVYYNLYQAAGGRGNTL